MRVPYKCIIIKSLTITENQEKPDETKLVEQDFDLKSMMQKQFAIGGLT